VIADKVTKTEDGGGVEQLDGSFSHQRTHTPATLSGHWQAKAEIHHRAKI